MATKKTSGGSKRLASSLVALGSAVITAVYATGYVRTQAAADQIAVAAASEAAQAQQASATTTSPTVTIAPTPSPVPTNTTVPTSPSTSRSTRTRGSTSPYFIQPPGISQQPPAAAQAPAPTATTAPTSTPSTAAAPTSATSKYKDGTYTGVGYSRHGGVQATVVIKGGRIVSADVSGCSTRYPCSAVDSLPAEVVSQQTYQVDYVSGATDSSMAYQGAVEQALAQAAA